MSQRRGSRGLGSRSRSALVGIVALVVVLVVVDVVLVALAVARTAPSDGGTPGPVPTFTSTPQPDPSGSASPQAEAGTGTTVGTRTSRLLSAADAEHAWRASSPSCASGAATLERSADGGATWTPVDVPAGLRTVLALRASTTGVALVGGFGDDCAPSVRSTTDGGTTWRPGAAGSAGAGIADGRLLLRADTEDAPCASPTQVSQGQYTTVVACSDELDWRSGTGDWVSVPVDGLRAVADGGQVYTLARSGADGCPGVQVESIAAARVTASSETTTVGCAAGADTDGPVAIGQAGRALWLWAGDAVVVSRDGGASW